jgi:hypothetical protein
VDDEFGSSGHTSQHVPQLLVLFGSMHSTPPLLPRPDESQVSFPAGQLHLPLVQVDPDAHAGLSQPPQCLASEVVSMHAEPHFVNLPLQLKSQVVPLQVGEPDPEVGPGHLRHPLVPHASIDVLVTH